MVSQGSICSAMGRGIIISPLETAKGVSSSFGIGGGWGVVLLVWVGAGGRVFFGGSRVGLRVLWLVGLVLVVVVGVARGCDRL